MWDSLIDLHNWKFMNVLGIKLQVHEQCIRPTSIRSDKLSTCIYIYRKSCKIWSDILQAITLKNYTAHLSLTTLVCFLGTLQSMAVTFVMENKASVWSVGWDMNLLAAVYAVSSLPPLLIYIKEKWVIINLNELSGNSFIKHSLLCPRDDYAKERACVCHSLYPYDHDHCCYNGHFHARRQHLPRTVSFLNLI